jgi:hypothetical protein
MPPAQAKAGTAVLRKNLSPNRRQARLPAVFWEKSGNISEKIWKNYLQNGCSSYIIIRHGLLPIVINTTHPVIVPPSAL